MATRGRASTPQGVGPEDSAHALGGRRPCRPGVKGVTVAESALGGGRWPTRSDMNHVERCAWFLRCTLVRVAVRSYLPWGLLSSMLVGSVLKEVSPLPESYFSNKRNVLNV